jgi:hypothetical protein
MACLRGAYSPHRSNTFSRLLSSKPKADKAQRKGFDEGEGEDSKGSKTEHERVWGPSPPKRLKLPREDEFPPNVVEVTSRDNDVFRVIRRYATEGARRHEQASGHADCWALQAMRSLQWMIAHALTRALIHANIRTRG